MKNKLLLALSILFAGTLLAQNRSNMQGFVAADTLFPFNIPLVSIDSSKVQSSKRVMALPKKTAERQPTVIAFWLTTCIPCHQELATYTANYASWKQQANFNLYAISTDFPKNFRKIAGIVREKQFPFEVYWDRDRLFKTVMPGELNGLPQVFIFDKNGQLAYRHKGFRPGDEATLFAKIKELQ